MSASARRAAVLGHPISHSLSPVIHLKAYELLGLPWTYERIDLMPDQLGPWLDDRDEEWAGVSLTMPLKTDVLSLLDHSDSLVQATGAANTVVFAKDGRHGYNTDVGGMVSAVRNVSDAAFGRVLIVGAGATARSAVAAAAELGASDIDVLARRPQACADLLLTGKAVGVAPHVIGWTGATVDLAYDLVISTVPAGVADVLAPHIPVQAGLLLDVVYQSWPTPLASAWEARGGVSASGLEMLLYQGVAQVALMTGQSVEAARIRPSLLAAAVRD
jgi:shikimate dehydrogenase